MTEPTGRSSLTKGSVLLTAAGVLTVGLGYALNVYLARTLGLERFGLLGVVLTVLVWLELVVAEGLPLWLARTVDRAETGPLMPRSYAIGQVGVSLLLSVGLIVVAPWLARIFAQPAEATLFRVAAIDIPLFGLYNLFLAVLLGTRAYWLQAASTTAYSVVKLIATVSLVGAGLAVLGGVLGSVSASLGGLVVTVVLVVAAFRGRPVFGDSGAPTLAARSSAVSAEWSAALVGGALAGSVVTAMLVITQSLALSADLWLVKALLPGGAAGYYRAASLIAQVPLALGAGAVWGLYAAYSEAQKRGDTERQRHYVSQATRLFMAVGGLWVAIVVPSARSLMVTVYSPVYAAGGSVLSALAIGTAVGAVGVALAPILILEGHVRAVVAVPSALVALEIVIALVLIPRVGAVGAAVAVALAFSGATVAVLVAVKKRLSFPMAATSLRLLVPAFLVLLLGLVVRPAPGIWLLGWYVVLLALYCALLFLTGGLTLGDVEAVMEGFK